LRNNEETATYGKKILDCFAKKFTDKNEPHSGTKKTEQ